MVGDGSIQMTTEMRLDEVEIKRAIDEWIVNHYGFTVSNIHLARLDESDEIVASVQCEPKPRSLSRDSQ